VTLKHRTASEANKRHKLQTSTNIFLHYSIEVASHKVYYYLQQFTCSSFQWHRETTTTEHTQLTLTVSDKLLFMTTKPRQLSAFTVHVCCFKKWYRLCWGVCF